MLKRVGSWALVAAVVLTPTLAHAGRGYGGGGVVMGPDGPLYNTNSPEWKAAGGNIFLYQQIMQQKMLMQQQQLLMKQQQQMLKNQKNTPSQTQTPFVAPLTRTAKKKKRTYVPTGNSAKTPSTTTTATSTPTPAPTTGAKTTETAKTPSKP